MPSFAWLKEAVLLVGVVYKPSRGESTALRARSSLRASGRTNVIVIDSLSFATQHTLDNRWSNKAAFVDEEYP